MGRTLSANRRIMMNMKTLKMSTIHSKSFPEARSLASRIAGPDELKDLSMAVKTL